ncbi:MAG: thiamine-phosphate kinase [Candidatus Nanopelagicales bacterium]
MSETTIGEAGEFGLIARITEALPSSAACLVGPGDDTAVVATMSGSVLATIDVLVEGIHFRRDWSSATDVGRKAAAASLADVAAMGGVATALLVGFAAPGDLPVAWALECTAGLTAEAARVGACVVGGDVVASSVITLSVTALGDLQGRSPVLRSGARAGDILAVAGRLGWSAAGLAVLSGGFRSPAALVEAHRIPDPPYSAGPMAADAGATAMIDVSDGLIADARHLAEASGVGVVIDTTDWVASGPMAAAASAFGVDPREWMLTGGEDHALLATFPAGAAIPDAFRIIGSVMASQEPGVIVDGLRMEGAGGHVHFNGRRQG